MLNIKDITKRNQNRPEPPEVTAIRENILNSFSKLEFQEGPHKYYIHNEDGTKTEVPSVSGVTHQFKPHFDQEAQAAAYALKHDMLVEDVLRMWEETNVKATNNGTSTHLFGEAYMHFFMGDVDKLPDIIKPQYEKGYLIPYSPKQEAILKYYEDLFVQDNIYPVLPEAQVYMGINSEYDDIIQYAGTFDSLFAYRNPDGKFQLMLHDFKGLPLDTPILTTNGFKTMGSLTTDDIVFDKNGEPTKILNKSEIHNNPCMKIYFNDGYTITADCDHRWLITFINRLKDKTLVETEQVMTTQELYDYVNKIQNNRRDYRIPKIKINQPLNYKIDCDLNIDPYVFGVWLGDGHSQNGYITNMYDEIFNEIEQRGYIVGDNVNDNVHCGKAKTRCVKGLRTQLNQYNLLNNKHIPDEFILKFNFEQRWEILQGLMDTDGYYNKTRKRFCLSTTRKNQKDFCVKLLTSLGIKPTIINAKGKCTNCKNKNVFDRFDVCFTTDKYPFKIRKVDVNIKSLVNTTYRTILKVEYVDTVPTQCIEVDSPSHTYLADNMLLVTHNTNRELISSFNRHVHEIVTNPQDKLYEKWLDKYGVNGGMALEPFTDLYDESYSFYILQLSAYSLCLQQLGYEIVDRRLIWLKDDGTYEKIKLPDYTVRLRNAIQKK